MLYSLKDHQNQEGFPNVVAGILLEFDIYFYALLDLGATNSFVTP